MQNLFANNTLQKLSEIYNKTITFLNINKIMDEIYSF